jgi:hypothetical protein
MQLAVQHYGRKPTNIDRMNELVDQDNLMFRFVCPVAMRRGL